MGQFRLRRARTGIFKLTYYQVIKTNVGRSLALDRKKHAKESPSKRPNRPTDLISVDVSPKAKAFLDALFAHKAFDPQTWSITSSELRAIVGRSPVREITRPMVEPAIDVFEDLWQLSHITPSYIGRATSAAMLLAYGMMEKSTIAIVALISCGISAIIGAVAGLSSADDAGRRYLIGVGAAVQYAAFPVWFGISVVIGFPEPPITRQRLLTLADNVGTIALVSAAAYGLLGMRRVEVHRFVKSPFWRAN